MFCFYAWVHICVALTATHIHSFTHIDRYNTHGIQTHTVTNIFIYIHTHTTQKKTKGPELIAAAPTYDLTSCVTNENTTRNKRIKLISHKRKHSTKQANKSKTINSSQHQKTTEFIVLSKAVVFWLCNKGSTCFFLSPYNQKHTNQQKKTHTKKVKTTATDIIFCKTKLF